MNPLQEGAAECVAALKRYVRVELFLATLVYLEESTTDVEFAHGLAKGECVKALRQPEIYSRATEVIDAYIAKHCTSPKKPEAA